MKNLFFAFCILIFPFALLAQPVSKKGEPYLPAAGDWAISIDAAPFLDYFGNFFSQAENTAPFVEFPNSNFAIAVKKFKTDDFAYRASARLNLLSDANRAFVPEFSTDPTNTTVEDKYTRTFTNLYFSLGVEKRKGSTRVQGFYGAEAVIGFGTENHKFEYGNDITQENTNPTRTEFEVIFQDDPREITNITEQGGFLTQFRKGTTFSLGARGFIGAEVFIFPKFSLGVEAGLSAGFFFQGNSEIVSEQWTIPVGGSTEQFVTTVTDEGGSSVFQLDNDNSGGAIFMNFYF